MHVYPHLLAHLPADFEVLLRGYLGDEQRHSLFAFLDATTSLLQPCHHKADVAALQEKMNLALAPLERDLPTSIQVQYAKLNIAMVHVMINELYYHTSSPCTILLKVLNSLDLYMQL